MKTLWGGISLIETPGSWGLTHAGISSISDEDIKYLVDLCKQMNSVGKNRRMPVCLDYMPISIYDNCAKGTEVRTMYCSVMPLQTQSFDDRFKICFRARPYAGASKTNEVIIDNVLRKYRFNYAAIVKLIARIDSLTTLQDVKDALQSGLSVFREILRMSQLFRVPDLAEYSGECNMAAFAVDILNPIITSYESAYKSVCNDNAIRIADKVIELSKKLLKQANSIIEALKDMKDSVLDIAIYVYVMETDAMKAAPYIVDLSDYSIEEAGLVFAKKHTSVQCIDSVGVINICTASLALLKELGSHSYRLLNDRYKLDANATAQLSPILRSYLDTPDGNDIDLRAVYNRHMFLANYELLQLTQLNRSVYSNNAQNLVGAFSEYVPLACKFADVPNPIFDTSAGVCPWNVLKQRGARGVLATALYQYATYTNGQYETFDHMLDLPEDGESDEYSGLRAVLLPCSLFDSLASRASSDGLFIEPAKSTLHFGSATKENSIAHSAYLSAIIMSAMLCSIASDINSAHIFTSEDGSRLADNGAVAGYYSFDTLSDKSRTVPRNVLADNIFGFCGVHIPLNCGEHVIPLSYYDVLLYKALVVSKHTPVGIDVVKRGLDFTRWLNLNPSEVVED